LHLFVLTWRSEWVNHVYKCTCVNCKQQIKYRELRKQPLKLFLASIFYLCVFLQNMYTLEIRHLNLLTLRKICTRQDVDIWIKSNKTHGYLCFVFLLPYFIIVCFFSGPRGSWIVYCLNLKKKTISVYAPGGVNVVVYFITTDEQLQ